MSARVVRVESDTDVDPTWEITVTRETTRRWLDRPPAADIPPDIRRALRAWLDTAEETS